MTLRNFLSRQKSNDSNLHEIIPISFNMCQILDDNYYNEKYLIQTRSQTKSSGTKLLEVHGVGKNLDPNLKPEKQHQEDRDLIPSVNQLISHPTCHQKFLDRQK